MRSGVVMLHVRIWENARPTGPNKWHFKQFGAMAFRIRGRRIEGATRDGDSRREAATLALAAARAFCRTLS